MQIFRVSNPSNVCHRIYSLEANYDNFIIKMKFLTTYRREKAMIQSKEDYKFYLEADRIALRITHKRPHISGDDPTNYKIWEFERLLRKAEYYENCKKDPFSIAYFTYLRYKLYKSYLKYGWFIPRNVFGPGLSIVFFSGPIVVNAKAKVGANCRIHFCVTIGGQDGGAPTIGDNVLIGPGAVIVGPIRIADGIAIGANSYVDKSFEEPGITIAGAPARKVSNKGFKGRYFPATEILRERIKEKG